MSEFDSLSEIQKERFRDVSGHKYEEGRLTGSFQTKRPYNKKWDLSPYTFSFLFRTEDGFLFCELDHRMTNNRAFGWDYDGVELTSEQISEVFPSHLF